jgi:hypothetical protein
MVIYQKLKEYEAFQGEILSEIISLKGAQRVEDIDENELWEFNQLLDSGWNIYPHGEHLSCILNKSTKIEIPLYVVGCIGVDPGHFNEYLASKKDKIYSYQSITKELELLEASGKAKKVNPENTSPVWKLSEPTT